MNVSKTHIRWMTRRDMRQVMVIEKESFDDPWIEDDFCKCLRQRNCIGIVAERDDEVIGYMIYELHKDRLQLLNFAVHSRARRVGVASAMIEKLRRKLCREHRSHIVLHVADYNLPAQLFFKRAGFRAVGIVKRFFEDSATDAYKFVYTVESEQLCHNDPMMRCSV